MAENESNPPRGGAEPASEIDEERLTKMRADSPIGAPPGARDPAVPLGLDRLEAAAPIETYPPRDETVRVTKKLALFSDGTGNSSAKAEKTNVWRLFQAMDLGHSDQLAMYDDGVGTSSNKYLAALGGALGWGLKRNVIDLYKFVCRNYVDETTDIYGFGFSRGAFTIRVLMGVILFEGLVPFTTEAELHVRAKQAYGHFRRSCFKPMLLSPVWVYRLVRYMLAAVFRVVTATPSYSRENNRQVKHIKFLGLWDTVSAYGMPIEELRPAISWLFWPMYFNDLKLPSRVKRACHALSLDDERTTFHPIVWDESDEDDQRRITQVWFAGVHANVGGGYPEDQLSLVSLDWMMSQAQENGLRLQQLCVERVSKEKSLFGRIYDSRAGKGVFYRYSPRKIKVTEQTSNVLPIVHGSVLARMARGADGYVPNSLPAHFLVLAPNGKLLPMQGFEDDGPAPLNVSQHIKDAAPGTPQILAAEIADSRTQELEKAIKELNSPDRGTFEVIEDTVWWRRFVYLICSVLATMLVLYPWIGSGTDRLIDEVKKHTIAPIPAALEKFTDWDEQLQGFATAGLESVRMLIPGWFDAWTATIKEHPLEVAVLLGMFILTIWTGEALRRRIHDYRLIAWHAPLRQKFRDNLVLRQKSRIRRTKWLVPALDAVYLAACLLPAPSEAEFPNLGGVIFLNVVVVLLTYFQLRQVARLADKQAPLFDPAKPGATYYVRNSRPLQFINKAIGNVMVPSLFAATLAFLVLTVTNRIAFELESGNGRFCKSQIGPDDNTPAVTQQESVTSPFSTDQFCWSTGRKLEAKIRYRIVVNDTQHDWFDKQAHTDPRGFPANSWLYAAATPLKRWWRQPWFAPIARVGPSGNHEYALEPCLYRPDGDPSGADFDLSRSPTRISNAEANGVVAAYNQQPGLDKERHMLVAEFTPQNSGELFLFVNDAVVGLPGSFDHFYKNNRGTASVTIEQVHEDRDKEDKGTKTGYHFYCPK